MHSQTGISLKQPRNEKVEREAAQNAVLIVVGITYGVLVAVVGTQTRFNVVPYVLPGAVVFVSVALAVFALTWRNLQRKATPPTSSWTHKMLQEQADLLSAVREIMSHLQQRSVADDMAGICSAIEESLSKSFPARDKELRFLVTRLEDSIRDASVRTSDAAAKLEAGMAKSLSGFAGIHEDFSNQMISRIDNVEERVRKYEALTEALLYMQQAQQEVLHNLAEVLDKRETGAISPYGLAKKGRDDYWVVDSFLRTEPAPSAPQRILSRLRDPGSADNFIAECNVSLGSKVAWFDVLGHQSTRHAYIPFPDDPKKYVVRIRDGHAIVEPSTEAQEQ